MLNLGGNVEKSLSCTIEVHVGIVTLGAMNTSNRIVYISSRIV